jgi:uncharacterized membrane protein YqgA involved in biofilm formation
MIGALLNVTGILAGGVIGLYRPKPLSVAKESFFKVALGAFTVFYGLRLTWLSLNGSLLQILKQLLIAILSLALGKIAGQLMRLQQTSNNIGRIARQRMAEVKPEDPLRSSDGFKTCAALFCAAPLGVFGAVQDGLSGYFYPLAIKGVMDGLAMMGFVSLFGSAALLSALPVLALQGTITLGCLQFLKPILDTHNLTDSVNVVGGLLVFSVALVILGLKKIALADYLPSLIIAPLLTRILL